MGVATPPGVRIAGVMQGGKFVSGVGDQTVRRYPADSRLDILRGYSACGQASHSVYI